MSFWKGIVTMQAILPPECGTEQPVALRRIREEKQSKNMAKTYAPHIVHS